MPRPFSFYSTFAKLSPSFALVLACCLPLQAHAFWGLLGKAAGAGGKAASTAGKGAAVGVVGAEGVAGRGAAATAGLGDDAARSGAKAGAAEFSAVNAALPPEVAAYLAKPAGELTPKDLGAMMQSYEQMVAKSGRTGDYTIFERAPVNAGAAKRLDDLNSPSVASVAPAPRPAPGVIGKPLELPLDAVRLLAHAANAGHREAGRELDRICTPGDPAANRLSAQVRYSNPFMSLCSSRGRPG